MTGDESASGLEPLVRKKQPRVVERTIRERDAVRLEWYFGEGKSTFSRSIFGGMLTRADLYRHGTYPCFRCEGSPGVDSATGAWCRRCKGTGFFSFELYPKGEVTAFPTLASQEASGYEPSHTVLQLYGKIARRLDVVASRGAQHFPRVLERFHGDEGARWGRTKHGRIFAVFPHTDAGRRLLIRVEDAKEKQVEMSYADRMSVQVELQRSQPKKWRRELLERANEQAAKVYGDAAYAWNLASFFLKMTRELAVPLSKHNAPPSAYATVREVMDGKLPVETRRAASVVEYETANDPCKAPKCGKDSVFPFLYCSDHQMRQPRE